MKRVAILGPAGAGKTELARELARRTGLPVVHLDLFFWRADWKPASREEALRNLNEAVAGERWILDGNFVGSDDARFERADTVILLDLPRTTCIRRVLWRRVRDHRRVRPDLPELERFDANLIRWVWRWGRDDRPRVLERMAAVGPGVAVHHLRTRADVARFLAA